MIVHLLTTGGTIASRFDAQSGGYIPTMSGAELLAAMPEIASLADVHVEAIANVDSADMTPDVWLRLSRRANALLADPRSAGVVITHGTDTLEETAYFMDLTVASDKPTILVGAQRPASLPDSDGPRNLLNAVRVAVHPEAAGKGAMVVMNGQIHAAREVTKTNTIEAEAFKTLEFGQLGYADLECVRFYRAPIRRQTIAIPADATLGRVDIVMHYAGADGGAIRGLLAEADLDGLVVAGAGAGHVNESMYEAIRDVRNRGIPVVISTRVYTGRTLRLYGAKGRGVSLREIGCIPSDNLSPQKARVLLLAALTQTRDSKELAEFFER